MVLEPEVPQGQSPDLGGDVSGTAERAAEKVGNEGLPPAKLNKQVIGTTEVVP